MLYTKAIIEGYSYAPENAEVRLELNCLISDKEIQALLKPLRKHFNDMGDGLNFKMTLEAEDC